MSLTAFANQSHSTRRSYHPVQRPSWCAGESVALTQLPPSYRLPFGLKPHAQGLRRNPRITFGEIAAHYVEFELPDDQSGATIEKAQSTIVKYKHYLNSWVLPKWQRERALAVHPFEVEDWFKQIQQERQLDTTTLVEIRKVMDLVYRHGQRHGNLPRTDEGNPMLFVRLPGDERSTPVSGAA